MWRRWNSKSGLVHDAAHAGVATVVGAVALCLAAPATALEWKSPRGTKPAPVAEQPTVTAERMPTPAPRQAVATRTSAESRIAEPNVGHSERLELSNGAELVWVTDQTQAEQTPSEQREAAQSTSAKPQSQPKRTGARTASLDTASALHNKALNTRTEKAAETSTSAANLGTKSNQCRPAANACCSTVSNGGKACAPGQAGGSDCCSSGHCGDGCGSLGGCGRLGCRGCGLCRRGDYMDRYANCSCDGSYKFPVPPLYTYHWPGMYSHQLMTDYHSPWRFPPLRPFTDEPTDEQLAPVE